MTIRYLAVRSTSVDLEKLEGDRKAGGDQAGADVHRGTAHHRAWTDAKSGKRLWAADSVERLNPAVAERDATIKSVVDADVRDLPDKVKRSRPAYLASCLASPCLWSSLTAFLHQVLDEACEGLRVLGFADRGPQQLVARHAVDRRLDDDDRVLARPTRGCTCCPSRSRSSPRACCSTDSPSAGGVGGAFLLADRPHRHDAFDVRLLEPSLGGFGLPVLPSARFDRSRPPACRGRSVRARALPRRRHAANRPA